MVPSRHAQIGDRMVAPRLHLRAHMDSAATAHQEAPGFSVKTITEDRCTIGQPEDFAPVSVSRIWIRNAGHRTGANQRVESTSMPNAR
jgi:hypothetical protein